MASKYQLNHTLKIFEYFYVSYITTAEELPLVIRHKKQEAELSIKSTMIARVL